MKVHFIVFPQDDPDSKELFIVEAKNKLHAENKLVNFLDRELNPPEESFKFDVDDVYRYEIVKPEVLK